jgi:hypothetical protein
MISRSSDAFHRARARPRARKSVRPIGLSCLKSFPQSFVGVASNPDVESKMWTRYTAFGPNGPNEGRLAFYCQGRVLRKTHPVGHGLSSSTSTLGAQVREAFLRPNHIRRGGDVGVLRSFPGSRLPGYLHPVPPGQKNRDVCPRFLLPTHPFEHKDEPQNEDGFGRAGALPTGCPYPSRSTILICYLLFAIGYSRRAPPPNEQNI